MVAYYMLLSENCLQTKLIRVITHNFFKNYNRGAQGPTYISSAFTGRLHGPDIVDPYNTPHFLITTSVEGNPLKVNTYTESLCKYDTR